MTISKDELVLEIADEYAHAYLQCKGEYHPNWHEVRDQYFAKLIRNQALKICDKHKCNMSSQSLAARGINLSIRAMKEN